MITKELRLNESQALTLYALDEQPLSTSHVVAVKNSRSRGGWNTYDGEHSRLRKLEDRGFVRRISSGHITLWELTKLGRKAMNTYFDKVKTT